MVLQQNFMVTNWTSFPLSLVYIKKKNAERYLNFGAQNFNCIFLCGFLLLFCGQGVLPGVVFMILGTGSFWYATIQAISWCFTWKGAAKLALYCCRVWWNSNSCCTKTNNLFEMCMKMEHLVRYCGSRFEEQHSFSFCFFSSVTHTSSLWALSPPFYRAPFFTRSEGWDVSYVMASSYLSSEARSFSFPSVSSNGCENERPLTYSLRVRTSHKPARSVL